jgi:hypothetical protein
MSSQLRLGAAPGQDTRDATEWRPQAHAECVCGAGVDREAARVMGVGGVVPACPACWESPDMARTFSTVAKAVAHFQADHGHRTVDVDAPVAHPEVEG